MKSLYSTSICRLFVAVVLSFFAATFVSGQEEDETAFVLAGVSPIILESGGLEVYNSSQLVSYWNQLRILDLSGGAFSNIYRLSQFQNTTSVFYGFSVDRRWDLGIDATYARQRWDDAARTSPFEIFNGDAINQSGLSYLGIRARVQPFASLPELTLQGGARIPMANGDELRRQLSADRIQINMISTFYKRMGYWTSYLLQGGWSFSLPRSVEETNTEMPGLHNLSFAGFLAFNIWNNQLFVVPGMSYSGVFQKSAKSSRLLQRSHAVLANMVLQFQFGRAFSISLQQGYPILFESYVPNVTYNRRSFTSSALVLRLLI